MCMYIIIIYSACAAQAVHEEVRHADYTHKQETHACMTPSIKAKRVVCNFNLLTESNRLHKDDHQDSDNLFFPFLRFID